MGDEQGLRPQRLVLGGRELGVAKCHLSAVGGGNMQRARDELWEMGVEDPW